ncbi:MAG: tetratricopeptide repeat protein, partial [Acidobacteriota bacterium]
ESAAGRLEQGEALAAQARLALAGGREERARELFAELLETRRESGDRLGSIDTLVRLGGLLIAAGQLPEAEAALGQALEISQDLSDVFEERRVMASLGEVSWRGGEAAAAAEHWQQALVFYRQREDGPREMLLSRNLARARATLGDLSAAEDLSHRQLELAQQLRNPRLEADASLRLTLLQLRQGYPSQARRHLDRSLEMDRHLDDRSELQRAIAWMAYEQGNYQLAVDTQRGLLKKNDEGLSDYDASFLAVFMDAREKGRRLPLPHEPGYSRPQAAG